MLCYLTSYYPWVGLLGLDGAVGGGVYMVPWVGSRDLRRARAVSGVKRAEKGPPAGP